MASQRGANNDAIDGDMPPAYQRLSDHCALIFEVSNSDDD
jgi:hypothetical protein